MNGWVATDWEGGEPWPEPADLRASLDAEDPARCCVAAGPRGYMCTRPPGHEGRHIAESGTDDEPAISAAWPGDHEPTAADLEAVPS